MVRPVRLASFDGAPYFFVPIDDIGTTQGRQDVALAQGKKWCHQILPNFFNHGFSRINTGFLGGVNPDEIGYGTSHGAGVSG